MILEDARRMAQKKTQTIKILKVLKNAMLVVNKHNRDEALT